LLIRSYGGSLLSFSSPPGLVKGRGNPAVSVFDLLRCTSFHFILE
jgi:hypothetical protein